MLKSRVAAEVDLSLSVTSGTVALISIYTYLTILPLSADLGAQTLNPESQIIVQQGNGQICIVNRAPNTIVSITADQVNDAINNILEDCCSGNPQTCSGGQDKITADSGNVIDLSVQGLGQNCTP